MAFVSDYTLKNLIILKRVEENLIDINLLNLDLETWKNKAEEWALTIQNTSTKVICIGIKRNYFLHTGGLFHSLWEIFTLTQITDKNDKIKSRFLQHSLDLFQSIPCSFSLPTSTLFIQSHGGSTTLKCHPRPNNRMEITFHLHWCWPHATPVLCSSWKTLHTKVQCSYPYKHLLLNCSN